MLNFNLRSVIKKSILGRKFVATLFLISARYQTFFNFTGKNGPHVWLLRDHCCLQIQQLRLRTVRLMCNIRRTSRKSSYISIVVLQTFRQRKENWIWVLSSWYLTVYEECLFVYVYITVVPFSYNSGKTFKLCWRHQCGVLTTTQKSLNQTAISSKVFKTLNYFGIRS